MIGSKALYGSRSVGLSTTTAGALTGTGLTLIQINHRLGARRFLPT